MKGHANHVLQIQICESDAAMSEEKILKIISPKLEKMKLLQLSARKSKRIKSKKIISEKFIKGQQYPQL